MKKNFIATTGMTLAGLLAMGIPASAANNSTITTIVDPIVELLNSLLTPLLAIVVALGSLYCVILGVKYAKAEEPQDREKAKTHLKNAIIGFVLIFVLMLALKLLTPALQNWVAENENAVELTTKAVTTTKK